MKLNFPLKTQDLSNWRSASDHYEVSQSKVGGWYPVGRNGFWHGGTHIDGNFPVHAVADGELIAYRVSEDYIDPESLSKYPVGGNEIPIVEFPISDNFVLTKHSFTPPEMKPIVFYVLYMNLLPFNPLKKQISKKQKALPVFFQSRFFVKNNATTKKAGLDIHDNGLSSVIGSVPAGAEVFFENPHEVAEDHQLKPEAVQAIYKKITGYELNGKPHDLSGYIVVDPSTIEVKKRIDYETDKVVTKTIPLKRGDIIGFPGGNGALENETSVHMEIFIKDEESYTALKQYTDKQKKELGLHDEVLLNLENYISSRSIISSVENGNNATDKYCNIIKILNSAYYGAKNGKIRIESIISKPNSYQSTINKLRRLVVKTRSEWKTVDGEFDRLKIENGGTHSDKKHKAYLELYQEKLDFWDKLDGFPDEVYFFHPIKFIEHLKMISKEDEIVFVPNCSKLGEETFLVLKPQESEELKKEEQELTKKIEKLKDALEEGKIAAERAASDNEQARKIGERKVKESAQNIKTVKEQIAKTLTSHAEGGGFDNLTEIRRLSGKKTTYVRSDKIKNHWRKYSLEADDQKKSLRTKNGQLDKKMLKERFLNSTKKVQKKFNILGDSLVGHENAFGQYIDELNNSLKWSTDKKGSNPEEVNFDASAQAQLLRYYANASLESTIDFKEMQFGFSANANASIALAEGKFQSRAYWPHKGGYDMSFELNAKRFDFGRIRAYLEFNATAFVGASAVGSICIEVSKPDNKDKLAFRGVNKAGKGIKPDKNTATGKLFAGAEAGGEVVGKCEWDNPEKRTDPIKPAWCEFVAIGYGIKGAAGLGVEAEFKISYEDNKFMFRARAGLVIGLGAGGSLVGTVDAGTIMEFVQFIYHQLKNHGYHFLDTVSRDAFNRITRLTVWAIETGKDIADFGNGVTQGISDSIEESVNTITRELIKIQNWWDLRQESKYQAIILARNILSDPDKIKFTTPEAKGIMLHHLCQTFWEINEEPQEQAIIEILKHVQSTGEYQKVCEHLTPNGSKTDFLSGHGAIVDILDGEERYKYREMRRKWRNALVDTWESGWESAFNETTKKDSPVEICELV